MSDRRAGLALQGLAEEVSDRREFGNGFGRAATPAGGALVRATRLCLADERGRIFGRSGSNFRDRPYQSQMRAVDRGYLRFGVAAEAVV